MAQTKAIVDLCNEKLNSLKSVPRTSGRVDALDRAERILIAIRDGEDFDTISSIFKEGPTPMSFNGAWLPRELHRAAGRIVEENILIVRTSSSTAAYKTYGDLAEMEVSGQHISDAEPRYVGAYVKCFECGEVILVKELAHQGFCSRCEAARPGRPGAKKSSGLTKMSPEMQKLYAYAKGAFRHQRGALRDAMVAGLNSHREICGLIPIDTDDFTRAEKFEDLMR